MEEMSDENKTYVGDKVLDMDMVKADIKPWTAKDGGVRYYIYDIGQLLNWYRGVRGVRMDTSYDWANMRASPARVRQIIEGNILPKTKAFVDENGHVNIYGWAIHGQGAAMGLPEYIEDAAHRKYGHCSEKERYNRLRELVGDYRSGCESLQIKGEYALTGDTVLITSGRKQQGKEFVVAKKTLYQYNQWARPSIYLYAKGEDFKVNAEHCDIIDLGYGFKQGAD